MQRVVLSTSEWEVGGLMARSFADRLFGVWRAPEGAAVVMSTRSVHSFGRRQPLEVVGLDAEFKVVATRTLRPNRVVVLPMARLIVELPGGWPVPDQGDRVELTHG